MNNAATPTTEPDIAPELKIPQWGHLIMAMIEEVQNGQPRAGRDKTGDAITRLRKKERVEHPGKMLRRLIKKRCLSVPQFSQRVGIPLHELRAVLNGFSKIDHSLAKKIGNAIGNEPAYWLDLQTEYYFQFTDAPPWALEILQRLNHIEVGNAETRATNAQLDRIEALAMRIRPEAPAKPFEPSFIPSSEVMKMFRYTNSTSFWDAMRRKGVPFIKLNQRKAVFERTALRNWIECQVNPYFKTQRWWG